MNVLFRGNIGLNLHFEPGCYGSVQKQEIADYLLGKNDESFTMYYSPINERQLLMSYLPFINAIYFYNTRNFEPLPKRQIEIYFERSSLSNPSNVILEVSQEMYDFLKAKKPE